MSASRGTAEAIGERVVASDLVFANPLAMQGYDSDPGAQYAMQVLTAVPLTMSIDFLSGAAYKLPKIVDVPLCRPSGR